MERKIPGSFFEIWVYLARLYSAFLQILVNGVPFAFGSFPENSAQSRTFYFLPQVILGFNYQHCQEPILWAPGTVASLKHTYLILHPDLLLSKLRARSGQIRYVHVIACQECDKR